MSSANHIPIVSTQWLAEHIASEALILLDASMEKVVGKAPIVYETFCCISGAIKCDLENELCDLSSSQTHAFPTEEQFMLLVSRLGITRDSQVVIYDNQGIYSSPRAWWIFKTMGFNKVCVLDGGLPQWIEEGRLTASCYSQATASSMKEAGEEIAARRRDNAVCASDYVMQKLNAEQAIIFDARGAARFLGQAPEPREGVRSGHIPSAINLPFTHVLNHHCLKSAEELDSIYAALMINDNRDTSQQTQWIFSCGSGITACILILAAVVIGHQHNVLYDGSWADWGADHSLPIVASN